MSHVMQYQPQWTGEDFVDFIVEKITNCGRGKSESHDCRYSSHRDRFYQIQLQPNHNFQTKAFCAGQSILVTVVKRLQVRVSNGITRL